MMFVSEDPLDLSRDLIPQTSASYVNCVQVGQDLETPLQALVDDAKRNAAMFLCKESAD